MSVWAASGAGPRGENPHGADLGGPQRLPLHRNGQRVELRARFFAEAVLELGIRHIPVLARPLLRAHLRGADHRRKTAVYR